MTQGERFALQPRGWSILFLLGREIDGEGCALAGRAIHRDNGVVGLDDAMHDGQA